MKKRKFRRDSGFGNADEIRDGEDGFLKLSRRSDDERVVLEVMRELDHYFSTRGITYLSGQRELLQAAAERMLNGVQDKAAVVPLLPGMGKSTLIRALLTVLSKEFANDSECAQRLGGVIIVVEKTAEAYELYDLVNRYGRHLAHVLEAPNDYNIAAGKCLRDDVHRFEDCDGQACPFYAECPLVQSKTKANTTPILLLLHARYDRFVENMAPFESWTDGNGELHARTLLIVDEAPSLMEENRLCVSEIAELESKVSRLRPSYREEEDKRKRQLLFKIAEQLRGPFYRLLRISRIRDTRIRPISNTMLTEAGFTEQGLEELGELLSEYAGSYGEEWSRKLMTFFMEAALCIVGQETTVIVPTRRKPDSSLRTFLLSGSAALSPELCRNPDMELMFASIAESYARLTLHVQQTEVFGVSKTSMHKQGNRRALVCWLRYRLAQISPDRKVLVVTYKAYAAELWTELSMYHDRLIPLQAEDGGAPKASLPYFGGMNGSNRYAEASCVICAGLGRFDSTDYLCRALAYDFDGSAYQELCQRYSDCQLKDARDLAAVTDIANLTLARDLVQLVFRSMLRKHGETEPIDLWLIQPPEPVLLHLQAFFGDCRVVRYTDVPPECEMEVSANRTVNGELTHAAKLLRWLQEWDGSEIASADVQKQLAMTPPQWKEARKNKNVRKYFESYVVSRKNGRYIKKKTQDNCGIVQNDAASAVDNGKGMQS